MTGARSIAEQALPYCKPSGNGWLRGPCPFCEMEGHRDRKASFGVSPSGIYSCFRCGRKGKVDVPADLQQAAPTGERAPMGPPEGFEPIWERDAWEAECYAEARAYLAKRGVGRALAREVGIGAVLSGRYHHRVVAPVLGDEGVWLGWVGRTWGKSDRPYIYPEGEWRATSMFNHACLRVETDEPALVVEGFFDALAYWPDSAAVLGKPSEWQVDALVESRRPVAVVLDGDAWREGWSLGELLRFRGQRAGSVRLDAGLDPDEVDRGWLREEARRCLG